MFIKRFTVYCIFILVSLIAFYVYAHWDPDPGPNLIEGDVNNLNVTNGHDFNKKYLWKQWEVDDTVNDVQNKVSLRAKVLHKKKGLLWLDSKS